MGIKHHQPGYMPPDLDYGYFAKALAEAQYSVGLLQGSQGKLKNAMHLIGPLVAREAAVSSKIEGTQSTSSDIYIYDAGGKPAYHDTPMVSNYRVAMINAVKSLQSGKKLSAHLIRALHSALLKNVRHRGILGSFREGDVWIGERDGDPIEKALYIPPEHIHVSSYVENLLDYIENNTEDITLVKAGVVHYQFEAVHPFDDGNGRIGRLLIPLILFYKRELSLPIVYSSGYFEARPEDYRNALREVDKTGKYESWLNFFFNAITEQAKETISLIDKIQSLNNEIKSKYETSKSPYMNRVIDFLFDKPVFTIPILQANLSLPVRLTIVRLVEQLESDRIVVKVTDQKGQAGARLYALIRLLEIIR